MSKKVSKEAAINAIKKIEALEIALAEVDRNENTSVKRQKVAAFSKLLDEYLKSERDLVLVAVKVK
jgi:hypothetical protein